MFHRGLDTLHHTRDPIQTARESHPGAMYPHLKVKICTPEFKYSYLLKILFSVLRTLILRNKVKNAKEHHH
jgi:hypothetical protein